MKRLLSLALLSAFSIALLGAQAASVPKVDGLIGSGEYPAPATKSGMRLGSSFSPDGATLYLALAAPTQGWVALGLGSLKMNGAYIVMGYDDSGKPTVSEQAGKGHGHQGVAGSRLLASAVKEGAGETVLELAVKAADFAQGGSVKLIMAYGKSDGLSAMHRGFSAIEIPLPK